MRELFRRSARLFARPSFSEGVARVLDVGATLNEYNRSRTEEEADAAAIMSDWQAVGDDLTAAMNSFERKSPHVDEPS